MEKTESDRLAIHKISNNLSQKCSFPRKEGSAKKEQGSHVAQEREVKLQGHLRPLVPFFVPGEETSDDNLRINDSLRVPSKTSFKASREPKEVIVRTWDREQGFFEEAVHRVTESSNEPKSEERGGSVRNAGMEVSAVEVRTKLLTPDSILARASAKKQVVSPSPIGITEGKSSGQKCSPNSSFERDICRELNFSEQAHKMDNSGKASKKKEQNQKHGEHKKGSPSGNHRQSSSPKQCHSESLRNSNRLEDSEKGKRGANKEYRTSEKQRVNRKVRKAHNEEGTKRASRNETDLNKRFAGSSYDTASPPPASLPLPSFVK